MFLCFRWKAHEESRPCLAYSSYHVCTTRHGYDSFLYIPFNTVSKSFDSTKLMTHSGFTKIGSNQLTTQNGFLAFNSNRLTTIQNSQNFDSNQHMTQNIALIILNIIIDYYIIYTQNRLLIQFDSWLKNYLKYWFESAHESMIRIKCWLGWPFFGFPSKCWLRMTFFGRSTKMSSGEIDSKQLMIQAVSRGLESIPLMTQAALQELT